MERIIPETAVSDLQNTFHSFHINTAPVWSKYSSAWNSTGIQEAVQYPSLLRAGLTNREEGDAVEEDACLRDR
jgi:hypothetical protein